MYRCSEHQRCVAGECSDPDPTPTPIGNPSPAPVDPFGADDIETLYIYPLAFTGALVIVILLGVVLFLRFRRRNSVEAEEHEDEAKEKQLVGATASSSI